jgi:uncharacterized protein (DUF2336 family)
MAATLTQGDVARLMADASPAARAETAVKIAAEMDARSLTQSEQAIAEDIVRIMARDASAIVREALAASLKASPALPPDVAGILARDIDSVALPILEFSEVLGDADLVALVRASPADRQAAIARRRRVSATVSDAIVDGGQVEAVGALLANAAAEIGERALTLTVERWGHLPAIQEPIVRRPSLPVTVAERMVAKLSDQLRDYLVAHHELTADTAADLVIAARERATVGLAAADAAPADVERLARQLHANGRLTPSLVMRALCTGDMAFFEAAMAALGGVPLVNARTVIHDGGRLGLPAIWERSGLPMTLLAAATVAIETVRATDPRDGDFDPARLARTVIERILTCAHGLAAEDAEWLLRKLEDLTGGGLAAA